LHVKLLYRIVEYYYQHGMKGCTSYVRLDDLVAMMFRTRSQKSIRQHVRQHRA